ncbi:hypothetical protein A3C23_00425 [Candidatus Roizmanbacteria bacterium RIFCSPHIGHO2_02_FULL_37_13b]|uniref:Uncharacterized protein n=1 Tax=Candidatus Roizmanbacteria bacterium RIFCSPLOWO2_02_FULL_36_11 TaxID=1802071 RepID=A0A1F7JBT2_9BACT|nr:MAG: hypothetical protein A3C23_00425 [Candidatus Roizmanbacteria bacterium RIFCSPHIGHO2_02_FULL_37_13b]OGK53066.1 MAG: hypothetical protein A3H78_00060 [Candidatus Roizmanbacteria bacterium RIFCSPLOWO2_02_FULL_36_11]
MFHASGTHALNMDSQQYRIQGGNINIGAKDSTSQTFNLSTTLGQTAASQFEAQGYLIKAGFQYIHSIIPFTFAVSNGQISLGNIKPNTPSKATVKLTVSFGGAGEYQVSAAENGPLRTLDGTNIIPDTQCNGESEKCTEIKAARWNSQKAYGFGYSIKGDDIPSDFISPDHYRPFADGLQNEKPVIIMQSDNVIKKRESEITFKTNISRSQQIGIYQTIINFVAIPSF